LVVCTKTKKKGTGFSPPPVPSTALPGTYPLGIYPLVTTGGGALPLPTYCAQPAMLRRANIAAVARASFFIELSLVMTTNLITNGMASPLVLKKHTRHGN
jgi:hypothetical protein